MIKIKSNKMFNLLIFIILLIFYLYYIINHIQYFFNTILGRFILFISLIFFISLNKILGIIISSIIILIYSNNYEFIEGHKSNYLEPSNTYSEEFTNIYTEEIIEEKIKIESYLKPKNSNKYLYANNNIMIKEPKAYNSLMSQFSLF
jgi:hypothetical protein